MQTEQLLWTFPELFETDPTRANLLESAPSPDVIRTSFIEHFAEALNADNLRIGMEQSESSQQDFRVVLQFPIGATLFDQFFNATTGYRAQFRQDWQLGLSYNKNIIEQLREKLHSSLRVDVLVRLISSKFEDCGTLTVSPEQIYISLDVDLSKVWFCSRLMTGDGKMELLPHGLTGPRLRLDENTTWAAPARDDPDAWIEVKGAFIGRDGPYQPKDPIVRAKKLQASGEA